LISNLRAHPPPSSCCLLLARFADDATFPVFEARLPYTHAWAIRTGNGYNLSRQTPPIIHPGRGFNRITPSVDQNRRRTGSPRRTLARPDGVLPDDPLRGAGRAEATQARRSQSRRKKSSDLCHSISCPPRSRPLAHIARQGPCRTSGLVRPQPGQDGPRPRRLHSLDAQAYGSTDAHCSIVPRMLEPSTSAMHSRHCLRSRRIPQASTGGLPHLVRWRSSQWHSQLVQPGILNKASEHLGYARFPRNPGPGQMRSARGTSLVLTGTAHWLERLGALTCAPGVRLVEIEITLAG
jgi:hypothetical protein